MILWQGVNLDVSPHLHPARLLLPIFGVLVLIIWLKLEIEREKRESKSEEGRE
jgi:hypothetical protein